MTASDKHWDAAQAARAEQDWQRILARHPECQVATRLGTLAYREAAGAAEDADALVLLHGIGSGAASWAAQFDALGARFRVLAWDAPGYGASTPPWQPSPQAAEYVEALTAWLDALNLERVHLVGHSLGALIAGAFARQHGARLLSLQLLAPANGYGAASAELREEKLASRLALLDAHGAQGLAQRRSDNLTSVHASLEARAWVRWNMARIVPDGYRQASHLLANGDLAGELRRVRQAAPTLPLRVAVGSLDAVTPPRACAAVAEAAGVPLETLGGLGHACYVEDPSRLSDFISAFIEHHAKQKA